MSDLTVLSLLWLLVAAQQSPPPSVTFERFGALTSDVALKGLVAGSSLMFGAFIAKRFVLHLQPNLFRLLMDGIMLAAGASMFWNAVWNASPG